MSQDRPDLKWDARSDTGMLDPYTTLAEQDSGVAAGITLIPGLRVRQYEVIRELGRGGMSRVVLARDTKLGRRVAMKFLATDSDELTQRFLIEARIMAALNHENIVVIHEVDQHGGAPYMVLEFLDGHPLRKFLDTKPMAPGRVVELAVPIVRALVRAHDAGIVHRDLKPENVFVTDSGNIKVLDFGIAKLLAQADVLAAGTQRNVTRARRISEIERIRDLNVTPGGILVGTLPYMAPEQFGLGSVDHRTDMWALGIMLFEMITGSHPLTFASATALVGQLANLEDPMPRISERIADVPAGLAEVIDRCLSKPKEARYEQTAQVLEALERLLPGRNGRTLAEDESPYPGLIAFQEADADRFFGRGRDIAELTTRLHEQAMVGVVGPSGVGKSSFVRAGLVPALKASGESWQVHVIRPGRNPLLSLAAILEPPEVAAVKRPDPLRASREMISQMARELGHFGAVLRDRAMKNQTKTLIFIDQFEELYTLVPDEATRFAFTACLAAAADDPTTPVRVVISIRSDFLDRAAEDRRFFHELGRGLVFLQPLGQEALREALVRPLEMRGYRFETPAIIDDMLTALESTPNALPLLQFAAAKLWDTRDRDRRLLTEASYTQMGGISGALATHGDQVLKTLAPANRTIARMVLQRLVTPESTRAVIEMRELTQLFPSDPRVVEDVVNHLVAARLLVVQTVGESATVELVHESLIHTWPTLRRWVEEGQENIEQLAQLRTAAAQWDQKGRPQGLLWRDEALAEARRWHARYTGELPDKERAYLMAAFALGTRAARIKRALIVGTLALLSLAVAAGAVGLISIRNAEQDAKVQAANAEAAKALAESEKANAQTAAQKAQAAQHEAQDAETQTKKVLDDLRAADQERDDAVKVAAERGHKVEMTQDQLKTALARVEAEVKKTKELLKQETARREALEKQRSKIMTNLPK